MGGALTLNTALGIVELVFVGAIEFFFPSSVQADSSTRAVTTLVASIETFATTALCRRNVFAARSAVQALAWNVVPDPSACIDTLSWRSCAPCAEGNIWGVSVLMA